jgi:hypothetical protein
MKKGKRGWWREEGHVYRGEEKGRADGIGSPDE